MLRITVYDNDEQDICDYCRKSHTGKEIMCLEVSGRSWRDKNTISVHTLCLLKQIDRHDKAKQEAAATL